jgi:hypothetical protein
MGIGCCLFIFQRAGCVSGVAVTRHGPIHADKTQETACPPASSVYKFRRRSIEYTDSRRARPAGPRHWARCHGGYTSRNRMFDNFLTGGSFSYHTYLEVETVSQTRFKVQKHAQVNTRSLATHSTHISRDRSTSATWRQPVRYGNLAPVQ